MCRASPRVHASVLLAATLLPLCVFASPLRVHLVRCDSSVTDIPELRARAVRERTMYGLTKAVQLSKDKATLVSAGELESSDILVAGRLGRSGMKFRLLYIVQTKHEPKLNKQLAYEFTSPRLSDQGVTVMAQDIISEALKLEEARKAQAAMLPAPEVASAPPPPSAPQSASLAPTAAAPSQPVASPTPDAISSPPVASSAPTDSYSDPVGSSTSDVVRRERLQPLVVVHTGLAGLWGYGTHSFGIGAVIEPKWNINDRISAGLRFDGGVLLGAHVEQGGTSSASLGAGAATLAKGEYFFGDIGTRPFVGLGAGMYILANENASASNEGAAVAQSAGRFFGVAPQVGIDFGGLRLALTYNQIIGGDIVVEQNISLGIEAERIRRNYVQLELSGRLLKFGVPRKTVVTPSAY